jgi:hypothetical protein
LQRGVRKQRDRLWTFCDVHCFYKKNCHSLHRSATLSMCHKDKPLAPGDRGEGNTPQQQTIDRQNFDHSLSTNNKKRNARVIISVRSQIRPNGGDTLHCHDVKRDSASRTGVTIAASTRIIMPGGVEMPGLQFDISGTYRELIPNWLSAI